MYYLFSISKFLFPLDKANWICKVISCIPDMGIQFEMRFNRSYYMSHVMRKPVLPYAKQRHRSACALPTFVVRCLVSIIYLCSFYMQNLKPVASLYSCTGQFESYLVANPEDRFSRDKAYIIT